MSRAKSRGIAITGWQFEIEIEEEHPIVVQRIKAIISIKSPVLSKRQITCGKYKTPIRGQGRQFNITNSMSGKGQLFNDNN